MPEALVVRVPRHRLTWDRGGLEPVGPELEVGDLVDRDALEERVDVGRGCDPDEYLLAVRRLDRHAEPDPTAGIDRRRVHDRGGFRHEGSPVRSKRVAS